MADRDRQIVSLEEDVAEAVALAEELEAALALYASEYMADEAKTGRINRFFGAFCLFVFSMACLVMGDNLLLLFLGRCQDLFLYIILFLLHGAVTHLLNH